MIWKKYYYIRLITKYQQYHILEYVIAAGRGVEGDIFFF